MKQNSSSSAYVPNEEPKWTKVLFEIIIKILTLGMYHVEKHRKEAK